MKVRIVEWRYYVPDCPADLEVTDIEILGILAVDETVDERQRRLIERFKADRIQVDYEGTTTKWFAWKQEHYQPLTKEQKLEQIAIAEEERLEAQEDFEGHYDGYFNHAEYEIDRPVY